MRQGREGSPGDGPSIREVFAGSGFIYGIFYAGRPEPSQGGSGVRRGGRKAVESKSSPDPSLRSGWQENRRA